jgi:hypothetical protein
VGAGLPAKAVGQPPNASTDGSPSRASPLPQGVGVGPETLGVRRSNVGAGLPAKAVGQPANASTGGSPSRASPLPQGVGVGPETPGVRRSNVGAGLPAKAVGQPANASTDGSPSRASPLLQGIGVGLRPWVYADQMWELACLRKRWVSHRMHQLTDRLREQARSHRGLGWGLRPRVYANQMCGLPAKAVGQPANASTDGSPSRASPLPQGIRVGLRYPGIWRSMWELACLRKRWVSRRMRQLTDRLRGQASSHMSPAALHK